MKQGYHHGHLESALIDSGIKLLSKTGMKDFSLRRVAKEAGVSHTAPYRHFKNKEALVEAIAMEGFRLLTEYLDRGIALAKDGPLDELIEAGLSYYDFALDHPQHLQLMFSCEGDKSLEPGKQSIPAEYDAFGRLVDIFVRGREKAVFEKESSPQLQALAAWTQVHGYVSLVLGGQTHAPGLAGLDSKQVFRDTCLILYKGLQLNK